MVSLVMELMELHNEVGAKYSDDLRLGWALRLLPDQHTAVLLIFQPLTGPSLAHLKKATSHRPNIQDTGILKYFSREWH